MINIAWSLGGAISMRCRNFPCHAHLFWSLEGWNGETPSQRIFSRHGENLVAQRPFVLDAVLPWQKSLRSRANYGDVQT